MAPLEKKQRLSDCSTADSSADEASHCGGVRIEDDYDVCQAIADFALQRPGAEQELRLEDMRAEIRMKHQQVVKLASRADAESHSEGSSKGLHYARIREELLREIEVLERSLAKQEEALRALQGAAAPRRATVEAAPLAAQLNRLDVELKQARRLMSWRQRFVACCDEDQLSWVQHLHEKSDMAIARGDANLMCLLTRKAAACLSPPVPLQGHVDASTASAAEKQVGSSDADREAQAGVRRVLVRLLSALDLSAKGTKQRLHSTCQHIMGLVEAFERQGGKLSCAASARRWHRLADLVQQV
eukprot:TRINITY_DN102781_c0_g1_i1.p1 TRINITY_DN102781_c0_g1~~TRINITY_DN102781_c0_g1_i1.p1  ORF type:complete len:301 (-),score=80.58 TRINITY_DN102781_c0_g1_i1:36-938(-)